MLTSTFLLLLGAPEFAHAEDDDAPEFLLGDLGVRIDLPKRNWHMTRWSDWDFKADYNVSNMTLLMFAWATPVQVPVTTADGWGPVYLAKIEELAGADPKISAGRVEEVSGRQVAFVDAEFAFGKGGDQGFVYGATVEISNQNMHVAIVAPARGKGMAQKQLLGIMERLDFETEPEALPWGPTLEAEGITATLPGDWREPLTSEMSVINPVLGKLGLDDFEACWIALRPRAAEVPDVMATCQGGLLLGVVDEHSFDSVDPVIRQKMFGTADIAGAERVDLSDRVGFVYAPRDGLAVGVVPYDKGLARTWVIGEGDLAEPLREVMTASSYSGPHPASVGDQVSYWLTHRTTSPVVLCPLLCVVGAFGMIGLGGLALVVRRSGRNKYADFDDE